MNNLNSLDYVAFALLIVGGLNWGLIGFFGYDLVAAIFGDMSAVSRVIYALVGLSGLYGLYTLSKLGAGSQITTTTGRESRV